MYRWSPVKLVHSDGGYNLCADGVQLNQSTHMVIGLCADCVWLNWSTHMVAYSFCADGVWLNWSTHMVAMVCVQMVFG